MLGAPESINPLVPGGPPSPANADHGDAIREMEIEFTRLAAAHAGAVFISNIKTGKEGGLKDLRGGMLLAAGTDAGKLREILVQVVKEVQAASSAPAVAAPAPVAGPAPAPVSAPWHVRTVQIDGKPWYRFSGTAGAMSIAAITCGFHDGNFVVGVGDGSVEEILQRQRRDPPGWLTVLAQLPVERPSTVVYLNLKQLLDQVLEGTPMPKARSAIRQLGLDKLSALCSVSGLEGETFVSKLLLATDGEPQGPLLGLFSDQPLRAEDLRPIPRDAALSLAMRLDAKKVIDQMTALAADEGRGDNSTGERPWDGCRLGPFKWTFAKTCPRPLAIVAVFTARPGKADCCCWASRPSCPSATGRRCLPFRPRSSAALWPRAS